MNTFEHKKRKKNKDAVPIKINVKKGLIYAIVFFGTVLIVVFSAKYMGGV